MSELTYEYSHTRRLNVSPRSKKKKKKTARGRTTKGEVGKMSVGGFGSSGGILIGDKRVAVDEKVL